MTDLKGRVWAFVLYPESCIDYINMISYLERLGVPMAISPLHIPSKNELEEEEKKEHYHILMYFDGQKSQKNLQKLLDMGTSSYDRKYFDWRLLVDKDYKVKSKNFSVYPYFLKVNNISCYFRYLIHLDQPRKQQFSTYKISHFVVDDEQKYNHIVLLNGFNEKDYLTSNSTSAEEQLLDIVAENEFKRIDQLMKYLVYNKNNFLLSFIKKNYSYCYNMLLADLIFINNQPKIKKQ